MRKLAILLCAALALVLAACGDSGPESAQDVLRDTFGPDKPVKSGRLDLGVRLETRGGGEGGLSGPVELKVTGPFQSQGEGKVPVFDLDLGLTLQDQPLSVGAVSTGDKGFLKVAGASYEVGADLYKQLTDNYAKAAKQGPQDKGGTTFKTLGIDPLRWLRDPKELKEEEVGGVTTRHVSSTIDVPRFLTDVDKLLSKAESIGVPGSKQRQVPDSLTDAQRTAIQESVKSAKFDVWAGEEDGILRRLVVEVGFDVPQARRAAAGGLTQGTLRLNLTLADLNEKQEIEAPKGARPLSELTGALGGAAGGAGAGGTATTPQGSTTPPQAGTATSPQGGAAGGGSQYTECLSAAGDDLAKVQECASLIGQ